MSLTGILAGGLMNLLGAPSSPSSSAASPSGSNRVSATRAGSTIRQCLRGATGFRHHRAKRPPAHFADHSSPSSFFGRWSAVQFRRFAISGIRHAWAGPAIRKSLRCAIGFHAAAAKPSKRRSVRVARSRFQRWRVGIAVQRRKFHGLSFLRRSGAMELTRLRSIVVGRSSGRDV